MDSVKTNIATTMNQLLKNAVERFPEKEAVYDGTRRLTYKELDHESTAIAIELRRLGINEGDHIAVSLPNWYEFVVSIFAIAKAGAVIIPFNTRYQSSEIEYILNDSKAKAAFFTDEIDDQKQWSTYYKIYQKSKHLKHLITVRSKRNQAIPYDDMVRNGLTSLGEERNLPEVTEEDLAVIMYTSGTTGNPKGAMLTHENITFNARRSAEMLECRSDDVFLIQVPLFHIFGMSPGVIATISFGAKMVLTQKFKAENALQIVEQEKITVHHGVPTMFILELNHPNLEKYDLTSLRTGIVAAAPVPSEVIGRIREKMHCEVLSSYGMTETSPSLTFCTFEDDDSTKAKTVGRAMPGVQLKLIDPETGEEVETGEVGEITAKSDGVMKGYYRMPEKTKEVFTVDGWYRTGDLGTMDVKGNIRIVGRKKDLIIQGGYNIYPREVEEYFYKLEDVVEVAIVGLPDTVLGQVSCAAVTLKENSKMTEEDLQLFIEEKVADFKVPDMITIVNELPMTASGKISKISLQNELEKSLKHRLR